MRDRYPLLVRQGLVPRLEGGTMAENRNKINTLYGVQQSAAPFPERRLITFRLSCAA